MDNQITKTAYIFLNFVLNPCSSCIMSNVPTFFLLSNFVFHLTIIMTIWHWTFIFHTQFPIIYDFCHKSTYIWSNLKTAAGMKSSCLRVLVILPNFLRNILTSKFYSRCRLYAPSVNENIYTPYDLWKNSFNRSVKSCEFY